MRMPIQDMLSSESARARILHGIATEARAGALSKICSAGIAEPPLTLGGMEISTSPDSRTLTELATVSATANIGPHAHVPFARIGVVSRHAFASLEIHSRFGQTALAERVVMFAARDIADTIASSFIRSFSAALAASLVEVAA